MMKHYQTYGPLMVVLAILLLCGCTTSQQNKKESVLATALLLDEKSFPPGWVTDPEDNNGEAYADRTFEGVGSKTPGVSFEEVYVFLTEQGAKKKYTEYVNGEFNQSPVRSPFVAFKPPAEINYKSKIADEYYFVCGVDVVPRCELLLRYRNYFILFNFDHATDDYPYGLTYPQIEKVLADLETKLTTEFGSGGQ
jgi:hypothetical protein